MSSWLEHASVVVNVVIGENHNCDGNNISHHGIKRALYYCCRNLQQYVRVGTYMRFWSGSNDHQMARKSRLLVDCNFNNVVNYLFVLISNIGNTCAL